MNYVGEIRNFANWQGCIKNVGRIHVVIKMDKKKTIYFPIEHTHRELKSKVYLASLLADHGYRCYLGSGAEIMRVLRFQKNSLLFHKSTCVDYVQSVKKRNHKIVFMDEELGFAVPKKGLDETVEWRYQTCNEGDYELSFAISERVSNLINNATNGKLKTMPTGWPRFDLLIPSTRRHTEQTVRNKVLLLSSFGRITESTYNELLKQPSGDEHYTNKHRWKLFNCYIESIPIIAELLKKQGLHLVIRPHPSESHSAWKRHISGIENTTIDTHTDLADSFADICFAINPGSTSAVQAALVGIPSICLPYEEEEGLTDTPVFWISKMAFDEKDLVEKGVQAAKQDGDEIRRHALSLLTTEISNLNNRGAAQAIINEIAKIDFSNESRFYATQLDVLLAAIRFHASYWLSLINNIIGLQLLQRFNYKWEKRPNGICSGDVNEIIKELQTCGILKAHGYHVDTVVKDIILIEGN